MRLYVDTTKTLQMKSLIDLKEMGQMSIDKVVLEWFNRVNFRSKLNPMEAKDEQNNATNQNTEIISFEKLFKII